MNDARGNRGQTEGLAVVLLTAIVILGVGTFGAFYLGTLDAGDEVSVDLRVVAVNDSTDPADETTLTVTHAGGEPIDDGRVFLEERDESYALPDPFVEGVAWNTSFTGTPVESRLRVLVVENDTRSVVFDSRVTVRDTTAASRYVPPTEGGGSGGEDSGGGGGDSGGADGDGGGGDGGGGDGDSSGVRDPGFAYLDYNDNRVYDSDTEDTEIDLDDNDNGDVTYTAPSGPTLVIPDSVSDGELEARNGKVRLVADSVDVDVSLTSTTSVVEVVSQNGTIYVGSEDTLYGQNGRVALDAAGDILADGATVRSDTSEVSLTGNTMSLSAATFDAKNGPVTIDASGDVDASASSITSATSAVSVIGDTIDLSDATVTADNNPITVDASGDVNADSAAIQSGTSTVELTGDTVRLAGATVTSDNRDVTIEADSTVEAAGSTVFRSSSVLSVTGASVDVRGAALESTNRGITLTATAGDIDIRNAELTTASQWQDAVADVTGGGTVFLDSFKLTGDTRLDVRPDDAYEPQSNKYKNQVE